MSNRTMWNERAAWLALVAVLGAALSWIVVAGTLAVCCGPLCAAMFGVIRALVGAALAVGLRALPFLPLVLLGAMILASAADRAAGARRRARP